MAYNHHNHQNSNLGMENNGGTPIDYVAYVGTGLLAVFWNSYTGFLNQFTPLEVNISSLSAGMVQASISAAVGASVAFFVGRFWKWADVRCKAWRKGNKVS